MAHQNPSHNPSEFAEMLSQLVYEEKRNGIGSVRALARAIVRVRGGDGMSHTEVENVRRQLTRIMKQGQTPEEGTVENIRCALGVTAGELPTPPSAKGLASRVSRLEQELALVRGQLVELGELLSQLRDVRSRP